MLMNSPGKQETCVDSRALYQKREPHQAETLQRLKPYSAIYELVLKNNSPKMPPNMRAPNRFSASEFIVQS